MTPEEFRHLKTIERVAYAALVIAVVNVIAGILR